jgi:signal transduction histidine kinase
VKRWHRRWRHSIRWRLVTLFLLLALGTSAVFLLGLQRVLLGGWQGYARPLLADYADRLAEEIGSPPDVERARAIAARLPVEVRIDGPRVHYDSRAGRGGGRHGDDGEASQRLGFVRVTADGHRIAFGLGSPVSEVRPGRFGWITLAVLLLLTGLAYHGVRRMLAPLDEIGAGAERFGRGEFGQPIAVRRPDELGELADRINRMAGSLHGMLEAKRGLLLAISHELRSPLTRARVNAELLDETPEREALLRDLRAMRDLIADLLESERLAGGHAVLHAEATDVALLVRELVDAEFPGQALELDLAPDLPRWSLDAARVRLLLRNLIGNALRHGAGAGRPPGVSARLEGDRLAIAVRDHGPGVPPEQLPRLTEAFYRPDSSRTRAAGGVGLGLALCRLVAQAHGGELTLRNAQPGLEALVSLPSRPPRRPTAA